MITRRTFACLATGLLALLAACNTDSPLRPGDAARSTSGVIRLASYADPVVAAVAEATIGPSGGTLVVGPHQITFPAGALSAATVIRASIGGDRVSVQFEPHGLLFPADAQPVLRLNYGGSDFDPATGQVVYTDEAGTVLERLVSTVYADQAVVEAKLNHFSYYAAGSGN